MYWNHCNCPPHINTEPDLVLNNTEVVQKDLEKNTRFRIRAKNNGSNRVLLQVSYLQPGGGYDPKLTEILRPGEPYQNNNKVYPPGIYSLTLVCQEGPNSGCYATAWIEDVANSQYYHHN